MRRLVDTQMYIVTTKNKIDRNDVQVPRICACMRRVDTRQAALSVHVKILKVKIKQKALCTLFTT